MSEEELERLLIRRRLQEQEEDEAREAHEHYEAERADSEAKEGK